MFHHERQFCFQLLDCFIEAPFTFFEMKLKVDFDSVELGKAPFRKGPEALNAVDVNAVLFGKNAFPMVDSKMLIIADIDKSIVAAPAIGVDDRLQIDSSPDNALQCAFATIGDDLRVDASVPKKDAEDGLFEGASTAFKPPFPAPNPSCTEIAFIDFNLSDKLPERLMLMDPNDLAKYAVPSVDGVSIETQQMCCLDGRQIQTKGHYKFFNSVSADFTVFKHGSRLFEQTLLV